MNQMTMERLCDVICLPIEAVQAGRISAAEEAELRRLFDEDEEAFFARVKDTYQTVLYLYVKWASESCEAYRAAGIPDQVYYDTYRDLAIWYQHCLQETEMPGIKNYRWTALPLKRRIYRLGRLQFELSDLKEDVECEACRLEKGAPVLEVHIPEGEPLAFDAVREAFEAAAVFFRETVPYAYQGFHCESWLLAGGLRELLPETSNIIRFQSLFCIYDEKPSRQAEERIFGKIEECIEDYPVQTKLQKNLRQYLLSGKSVGAGLGIVQDVLK